MLSRQVCLAIQQKVREERQGAGWRAESMRLAEQCEPGLSEQMDSERRFPIG